jgi:hemerythrin
MYTFSDDMLIGNEQIDNEHRYLFKLLNDVHKTLESGQITAEYVTDTGKSLAEYAASHFAHEEAYMESINDAELPLQKQEHAAFKKNVAAFMAEEITEENAGERLRKLYNTVATWLYHHILGSDTLIGTMSASQSNALSFEFTDEYLTGVPFIDRQHEKLFRIIAELNDCAEGLKKGYDQYDVILEKLKDLKEYTVSHFADEEDYMAEIGYAELEAQKKAHKGFIEKLSGINLNQLDEHQDEYLSELISFLLKWLSMHILKLDKQIPASKT